MSYNLSAADRGVIVHAISEAELSCQYALAEDLRAILTRASAVTVAEPKAGQHCVRCGGTFGGWCDCSDNRAACARQQVEQYLASSDPEGHRQSIIDHEAEQQAEPAADEWAEFETALKQYAEACYRSESCSAMDAARARVCAIFSRAAQSGQRAANLSEATIQALWDEACNDSPQNPGWSRHIRFARAIEQAGQRAGVDAVEIMRICRLFLDEKEGDYDAKACFTAIFKIAAAAPTQQQEG